MTTSLGGLLDVLQFHQPLWLWLWPLSLAGLAYATRRRAVAPLELLALPVISTQRRYRHPLIDEVSALQQVERRTTPRRRLLGEFIVVATVLAALHLALAQPYRIGQRLPDPPSHRDVLFLVDVSLSMGLRDYLVDGQRVDRITMLKSVLDHFIDGLEGNRIGVVAFAESTHLLVPLTADYALLKSTISRLEPAIGGRQSDPGSAIVTTVQRLGQADVPDSDTERPVLVLLTDVNRPMRRIDPRAAAAFAAAQGYRLHTVAIGAGSSLAAERDSLGLLYRPANFQLIEEIARNGGGRFLRSDSTEGLAQAIETIQQAELRSVRAEPRFLEHPLYMWPLGTAMALWLLIGGGLSFIGRGSR